MTDEEIIDWIDVIRPKVTRLRIQRDEYCAALRQIYNLYSTEEDDIVMQVLYIVEKALHIKHGNSP
jgi:hypothetical protein